MNELEDLEQQLSQLERLSKILEPDHEKRKHLLEKVGNYSETFLENIDNKVAYLSTEDKGSALLEDPIKEEGTNIDQLLSLIEKNVDRPGLNPASGGHIAFIPGGGLYPSALGDYLADISNRYSGVFYANPGAVRMENMLIKWMCQLFGYEEGAGGNLCSGGSMANLIAIVTARNYKMIKGVDLSRTVIYSTQQAHHCTRKSILIAGLGETILRNIPMDDCFRMDTKSLRKQILSDKNDGLKPFMIIASAGTTDTGAIDPLDEIGKLAQKENLWFHVDAAYGGFFILCDRGKKKLKGIEKADSIVVDPHKGLFLPYGSGAVLIKDVKNLYRAHHMQANYMQDSFEEIEELSPADLSPELTKPFRGLRMWLPLKLFGLAPFRAALEEKILLCQYFYQNLLTFKYVEIGPFPELSVLIYRFIPPDQEANIYNLELVEKVKEEGSVFISSTTIDNKIYLRVAILCFRTHKQTLDKYLKVLKKITQ